MNIVRENGKVLNTADLFVKMCEISPKLMRSIKPVEVVDFIESRLEGSHCACRGNGVFEILPLDDEAVQEGGKRYMQCTICGEYSHL
jgi:hypothetical protein